MGTRAEPHQHFVADRARVRGGGVDAMPVTEKLDKAARAGQRRIDAGDVENREIRIEAETDRVYLEATGPITLEDPSIGRKFSIESKNACWKFDAVIAFQTGASPCSKVR